MIQVDPVARGAPVPDRPLRVAAVGGCEPGTEAYVRAVLPPEAVLVDSPGASSPWLDPGHLAGHAAEVDVLHVHDVPPGRSPGQLEHWGDTARRLRIPVVVTVHQLRASSACADRWHRAALAGLLASAEVVLTLTPGAADEIADRFGRTAIVVAHPSIARPVPDIGAERGLVGLLLGGRHRAVPDPVGLARAALSGAISGGGRLRVLAEPGAAEASLGQLAEQGVEVVEHPGPQADDWPAHLQQLHVAVLPERCTHSRNLEVCRDVGTRVVAPLGGWLVDQWSDVVTYADGEPGIDQVSVTGAVAAALARPMARPADPEWRAEQRAAVQRVHAEVYAQVAADPAW